MLRAIVLVPAIVLALGPVAAGQTPFAANHLVSNADWVYPTPVSFPYTDISGSEQTLEIPAGTALITWTCTMSPDLMPRVRPRIDSNYPTDGTAVRGYRSSGSWLTTPAGGTVTMALQAKNDQDGYTTGQVSSIDSMSWSIMVVPEAAAGNVPVIGTVGLIVMVILVVSAGAVVLSRRKQPVV